MGDKHRLGGEIRELKLGASFTNNKASSFHTLKCDFKPASVDASKMATLDVGTNNQVTVTYPHMDGSGIPQTVFKGNQRSYQKECVLIINRATGEMTLERLSNNIQVKKTRQEPPHKPAPVSMSALRPHTPVDVANNCTQRSSSRTRVASGARRGGLAKAIHMSPPRHRTSPPQAAPWSANAGQSTLASLPMIGLDDMQLSVEPPAAPVQHHQQHHPQQQQHHPQQQQQHHQQQHHHHQQQQQHQQPPPPPPSIPVNGHSLESFGASNVPNEPEVGALSSSSGSSSSDSDSDHSDSDAESEPETNRPPINNSKPAINGGMNGINLGIPDASMPMHLLNDDLCLSESGSDDD